MKTINCSIPSKIIIIAFLEWFFFFIMFLIGFYIVLNEHILSISFSTLILLTANYISWIMVGIIWLTEISLVKISKRGGI